MTQETALAILKTGANVFLTGEPGSGKTHTVNAYIEYLRECGIDPSITASTGIAATHIGGMTIHSWSGIGIRNDLTERDLDELAQKERLVNRLRDAQVLIIDEISMLSAQTLGMVEAVCRTLRSRGEPFGGLQVVLVGDFFQLPPISRQVSDGGMFGESASGAFAFESRVWDSLNPLVCYISEQHRQEDAIFLGALSAIRSGEVNEQVHACLAERSVAPKPSESFTKLFPHNADVDRLNNAELAKITAESREYLMESNGTAALVAGLKKSCLSPEKLVLKIGAKVMFTKNNFDDGFVNGTTGEVVSFSTTSGYPVVRLRSGEEIEATPMEWVVQDGARILAQISQVPLRLAWAITVHKSQGMSLDAAVMDLRGAFEYGQGYVALSRVRTLAGLYLLGYNERALEVHPSVSAKDAEFQGQSDEAGKTFTEMAPDDLAELHKNFIFASGGILKRKPAGKALSKTN